jgi:MYXO-CTERM domain-containing protein
MRSLNGDSNGKSIFVTFDNSNYQDLSLTLAERVTTTGPTDVAVSISTDGVNYTSVTSYVLTDRSSTFYLRTIDLSSADFTDGGSSVTIKLTYTGFSATSGTGAIRLDNVRIDGTFVPTPGAAALMGLGGLLAARRRR